MIISQDLYFGMSYKINFCNLKVINKQIVNILLIIVQLPGININLHGTLEKLILPLNIRLDEILCRNIIDVVEEEP